MGQVMKWNIARQSGNAYAKVDDVLAFVSPDAKGDGWLVMLKVQVPHEDELVARDIAERMLSALKDEGLTVVTG